MNYKIEKNKADVSENEIRKKMPEILNILLYDRTQNKSNCKNIIWANDNYIHHGIKDFSPNAEIKPELITGIYSNIILPRSLKNKYYKKQRTSDVAEVFTPTWMVKKQNDLIEANFDFIDLDTYIDKTWLEITCGEGPYLTTRYDMENGKFIKVGSREGFVDRKLHKINEKINDKSIWIEYVKRAYQSSYGFEWNGDSLLIARENLLYTFIDFYIEKWEEKPTINNLKEIAEIISYNIFQMDGMVKSKGYPCKTLGKSLVSPLSEMKVKTRNKQMTIDDIFGSKSEDRVDLFESNKTLPGKRVKIMNWKLNKMEYLDLEV